MKRFSACAFRALSLAALSLTSAACIAWTGKISDVDPDSFAAPQHPRALTFETVYRSNGEEKEKQAAEAAGVVAEALKDTGVFASVEDTTARGALHLVLTFDETFNEGAVFVSAFLCGFTFFVLPGYARANTSLEAVVYEGGVPRGPVKVDASVHVLMQILLLPATPFFWPPSVSEDLVRNLVFHAMQDARLGLAGSPQPSI